MWIARDDLKRSDFTKKTKAGDLYLFVNKPVLLSQYGMRFWAVDENEMEDLDGCVGYTSNIILFLREKTKSNILLLCLILGFGTGKNIQKKVTSLHTLKLLLQDI